jgi:predicted transcriptional regulator
MLYREAKNKKHQIEIVKQLTGYSDLQIEYILKKGGVLELKDDKKAMIMEQYNKGLSDTDIARETGIAQSQVSTFLRGEKLPANGKAWGGKKKETSVSPNVQKVVSEIIEKVQEVKAPEKIEKEVDKAVEEIKTVQPEVKQIQTEVKQIQTEVLKNLKSETQKNYEELKEVLPKSIPNPEDMPINYDVIETLTPQQYYELAKMTIELLKTIWG